MLFTVCIIKVYFLLFCTRKEYIRNYLHQNKNTDTNQGGILSMEMELVYKEGIDKCTDKNG